MKATKHANRRNHIILFLIIVMFPFVLSGCTSIENALEEKIKNSSGIEDDQDYIDYINWNSEEETPESHDGEIAVSFANNSNLDIDYYYDKESTSFVDINNCYLNPGDSIYSVIETFSSKSTLYTFEEFELYDIKNGERYKISNESSDPYIINIPSDYKGTSISVVPIGKYNNREIVFEDYYLLADGTKKELECQWLLNGEKVFDSVSINPLDENIISCDYSEYSDRFYVVSSYPNITENDENSVFFEDDYSSENNIKYSLQLHQYITLLISDNKTLGQPTKAIYIDGEKIDTTAKIEKLKVGQQVKIRVDKDYIVSSPSMEITNKTNFSTENEYTLKITDTTASELTLSVLKSTNSDKSFELPKIDNGVIGLYRENGDYIENGLDIGDNENVVVKITPNVGYYISSDDLDSGIYSKKMSYKKYLKKIDSIIEEHPIKKMINLNLDTNDNNGICKYTLDGDEVSGKIQVRENQELILKYSLTSNKYSIKRKFYDLYHKLVNKNNIDIEIEINDSLNNKTIKASDFVELEAKDEENN